MKQVLVLLLSFMFFACSLRKSPESLDTQLKTSMSDYLNNDPKVQNKLSYTINSVTYFEDPQYYICEFQVRMTNEKAAQAERRIDTIGVMKVKIDKNFKVMSRYY